MGGNVNVLGSGVINGGFFDKIKVNGSAKVTADVTADEIVCRGLINFHANLEAKSVKVSGSLKVSGDVRCGYIKASGGMSCEGKVKCDTIEISGGSTFNGEVEAEVFKVHGGFNAKEINAGEVEIESRMFTAEIVHADKITIKFDGIKGFIARKINKAEIDIVECTEINAETLKAKEVHASKVVLGPYCDVDLVEYTESVDIHKDAKVGKIVKL